MGKASSHSTNVPALLERLQAEFPKKRQAFESIMRQAGIDQTITQVIAPTVAAIQLPTFDNSIFRRPSPMLRARFEFAGTWKEGTDTWLAPDEMVDLMQRKSVRAIHKSIRAKWEGSAPMRFADSQLTLFGVTDGVPENLTYLVWVDDVEPEVWSYVGMNVHRYKTLEEFLKAQLQD